MRVISFLYHDVIVKGQFDASGFMGAAAARYKLDLDEFECYLRSIQQAVAYKPRTIDDLSAEGTDGVPLMLTFDDGGSSAYSFVADCLERLGWRGHFLVTASYIGAPAFLSASQIRELKKRGHVIGSHSYTHADRMSRLRAEDLIEEWGKSVQVLSDILGEQVSVASIPGGYYSRRVAETAASVGIRALFTSEPTTRCRYVENCLVLGRYTVWRGMSSALVAGFASGAISPRMRQFLSWKLKKVLKTLGGPYYVTIRDWILEERQRKSFLSRCP